ncbi:MAG: PDZ domain-containing protein [Kofleriaceae bacterium]
MAFAPTPVVAGEGGIRVTSAAEPTASSDVPVPTAASPSPATAASPRASLTPAPQPSAPDQAATATAAVGPAAVVVPAAVVPAAVGPADSPLIVSRTELDRGLADFTKLSSSFRGTFTPAGVRLEHVGDGSLFAKAGLRAGDTIASVDGVSIRSLDDAADLYARATTALTAAIQVVRGGKPVTLRVLIQ